MRFLAAAGLLATLATRVRGATEFVLPGPNSDGDSVNFARNSRYEVGQKINVRWDSNWTSFNLYLLLAYPSELSLQVAGNTTAHNYEWTVDLSNYSPTIPDGDDYVFWFTIDSYNDAGETVDNSDSLFFNVSKPDTGGLSSGAVAGIAAGSTAAGLILIAGLIVWRLIRELKGLRSWKAQVEYDTQQQQQTIASPNSYFYSGVNGQSQMYQPIPPSVKTEVTTPHELASPPSPREMYVAPSYPTQYDDGEGADQHQQHQQHQHQHQHNHQHQHERQHQQEEDRMTGTAH